MSRTLHISNIPEGTTGEEIVALLQSESFNFHKDDPGMGYAKFASKEEAVKAVIECHNKVFKGRKIKVSFSKQSV